RIATEMLGPSARARSRASSSSAFCRVASIVRRCRVRSGAAATIASAACGASIGIGLRPVGTGSRPPGAGSSPRSTPAAAGRPAGGDAVEYTVARGARRRGGAVGPAQLRRLRQRHQQRLLGEAEAARLLAEIGERGGPDAFKIAAVRRETEIEREDLVLAV